MRAIRVRRHDGVTFAIHWLAADRAWTMCGRRVIVLDVAEELDLVSFETAEGCDVCEELARRPMPNPTLPAGMFRTPSYGTLRKEGPLYHGTKEGPGSGRRRGRRLW